MQTFGLFAKVKFKSVINIFDFCCLGELFPTKVNLQVDKEWVDFKKQRGRDDKSIFKHPGKFFVKNSNSFPRETCKTKPIGSEMQEKSKKLQTQYHENFNKTK